ncbi:MAG: DegT/DnrJ/EryC1/StrS family aminotransferase [Pseudonocardiaceae bacterium]
MDLHGVNNGLRDEFDLAWKSVLDHGHFVGGPEVDRFEREFATYCEAKACIGVANGTDALELILSGLGIGRGDEVIVPTNTFIATAEAVRTTGARPRFVDVCPDTLLIDPAAAQAAINSSTAAIMAVHLYGQMVDPEPISAIAAAHGLALIEDAAQAHGAWHQGTSAGSMGVAAGFSFYPGKNLGALGDGGAVVTSDLALADRIRSMANHGRSVTDRYLHDLAGRNSRLDTLQAALLSAKLPRLDAGNSRRAAAMAAYREMLPRGCTPVSVQPGAEPVYHLAVIQVDHRGEVGAALTAAGIGWGVHYPIPCHQQPALAGPQSPVGEKQLAAHEFPVAERAAGRILSLPMSPTLTIEQVTRVCDVLGGAL